MTGNRIEGELLNEIVGVITERILTPVLYMYCDELVEFVCFCDMNMPIDELRETEREVYDRFGVGAEIVDIREFDESDRMDIVMNAEIVYTANDIIRTLFEGAMFADMEASNKRRGEVIDRINKTGTYYMH